VLPKRELQLSLDFHSVPHKSVYPSEDAALKTVKCHDMLYMRCQDILYTPGLEELLLLGCAEDA
ncbi:MAG TPA: hypothetical protein VHM93_03225, partial [Candidatus Acidoferrum sp.]|nr:hypothetical protein [Candidatus Acidoferrum sp.]